jgi:hypothetical protein
MGAIVRVRGGIKSVNGSAIGSSHYPVMVYDPDQIPYDCLCCWAHSQAAGGYVIVTYDGACPLRVPAVAASS